MPFGGGVAYLLEIVPMCLILFAWRQHPRYPLVVAANRDEFHDRPTAAAAYWSDHPRVLAGRDLECGGTWLGITREGRFAAVTNFRDGLRREPGKDSRGWLTRDFLIGTESPADYSRGIQSRAERYNGFGLIVGDPDSMWYYSNRDDGPMEVAAGVYGLSNHLLDTPWPKVRRGKETLAALLRPATTFDIEATFTLLADAAPAEDAALPDTGVGPEWERALSAVFIRGERYGTRASTVLAIDSQGAVTLAERSFTAAGAASGTVTHRFTIS